MTWTVRTYASVHDLPKFSLKNLKDPWNPRHFCRKVLGLQHDYLVVKELLAKKNPPGKNARQHAILYYDVPSVKAFLDKFSIFLQTAGLWKTSTSGPAGRPKTVSLSDGSHTTLAVTRRPPEGILSDVVPTAARERSVASPLTPGRRWGSHLFGFRLPQAQVARKALRSGTRRRRLSNMDQRYPHRRREWSAPGRYNGTSPTN
jgi:hypothetical protein